jgi:hypothetical protein
MKDRNLRATEIITIYCCLATSRLGDACRSRARTAFNTCAIIVGSGYMALVLTGCALNVGMVKPEAKLQGIGSYNEPLQVYIDESIKNEFDVQTAELKTAHFKDYRRSLEEGFQCAFSRSFQKVEFTGAIPHDGYAIYLQKASPKHVVVNQFQTHERIEIPDIDTKKFHMQGGAYDTESTRYEVGISLAWYATLYQNGSVIGNSEGKLVSEDKAQSVFQAPLVMKNALEMMIERIGNDLFRKEVSFNDR